MTGELEPVEAVFAFTWICPACYFRHEWVWDAFDITEFGTTIGMQCEDGCGLETEMFWTGGRFVAVGPSHPARLP